MTVHVPGRRKWELPWKKKAQWKEISLDTKSAFQGNYLSEEVKSTLIQTPLIFFCCSRQFPFSCSQNVASHGPDLEMNNCKEQIIWDLHTSCKNETKFLHTLHAAPLQVLCNQVSVWNAGNQHCHSTAVLPVHTRFPLTSCFLMKILQETPSHVVVFSPLSCPLCHIPPVPFGFFLWPRHFGREFTSYSFNVC